MALFPRSLSLDHLRATLSRFPLAILSSVLCTALLIWTTNADYAEIPMWIEKMLPSLFIGILLFAGLALLAERLRLRSWLIQLLGIPLLYLLVYPVNQDVRVEMDLVHLGMVFVASLALVFVGPYVRVTKEEQGFWSYGILTLSRALTAITVAITFFIGFNLAIISIQELFAVEIGYLWPQYLMSFFWVFVASLVFFSGIPSDYKALQKEAPGDKAVRSIATYLSFPLLVTYFLILSAYVVKILLTQNWPEGFVALPVLFFALLGFGTYALVFPIREDKNSKVIGWFSKLFPWAVLPFLLVYLVAFWQRIQPYGITELRYLGVLLGLVLLGWSFYYGSQKKASLRWIPLSLVLVGLVFSVGPWSPKGMTLWSQMSRLETILSENGILVDGEIVASTGSTEEVAVEVSNKVNYIMDYYGTEPFEVWFGTGATGMSAADVVDKMGLTYSPYYGSTFSDDGYVYTSFWSDTAEPAQVSGYDYAITYYGSVGNQGIYAADPYVLPNGLGDLSISLAEDGSTFDFGYSEQVYSVPLTEFVDALKSSGNSEGPTPREDLSLSFEQGDFKLKIYFNSIGWTTLEEDFSALDVDTDIYLSVK